MTSYLFGLAGGILFFEYERHEKGVAEDEVNANIVG